MPKIALQFGTISVILQDEKIDIETLSEIAHTTMLNLLPEAQKILIEERKLFQIQQGAIDEMEDEEEQSCDAPPMFV